MSNTLIKARNLSRHYIMGDNTVKALDEVSFEINAGEFVMIVGKSGSGKSTLMNLIGLLDRPSAGELSWSGSSIAENPDDELSLLRNQHIGFIFQKFNLLSELTVLENIALPLAYRGMNEEERLEKARQYAEKTGLGERTDHRPGELSGGQNQRVAIARALAGNPDIILADEPTGALDSKTGREIMDMLQELNDQGHTIIMVTHDSFLARQGTRTISMQDGKIISDLPGDKKMTSGHIKQPSKTTGKHGLSLYELTIMGLREGILPHKLRSLLTMLGIIIGVAAVIAMSSFSQSSGEKQAQQIRALGSNLVRISDLKLENEKLQQARKQGSRGLAVTDMHLLLDSFKEIETAAAMRQTQMNILKGSRNYSAPIYGVSDDFFKVNKLTVHYGRAFEYTDHLLQKRTVIIGPALAARMNLWQNAVGQTINLSGNPYTIIGVLKSRNLGMSDLSAGDDLNPDNAIFMPLNSLLSRSTDLILRSEIDEIHLTMKDEKSLFDKSRAIHNVLSIAHNAAEDFRLIIPMSLLKQKQQSRKLLDILTLCISSIAMIVGGIGIMNIMLASVNERIREIGIRRAVGATQTDIKLQFWAEAALISVSGGLLGVVFALGAVTLLCQALNMPLVISWTIIIISLGAAVATGLIFGFYPAASAARKNPVEALAYE